MKSYESKPVFLARAAMKSCSSVVSASANIKHYTSPPNMMLKTFAPCPGLPEPNQFSLPILVAE